MVELKGQELFNFWKSKIWGALLFLVSKWMLLLATAVLCAIIGYITFKPQAPTYTANITFVLSTDQRGGGNNSLAGIAAQLGFDATTSSSENIFSGENIIELFKSRQLIGTALMSKIDSTSDQNLLTYIAEHQFTKRYHKVGPFSSDPSKFSTAQLQLYRSIISYVGRSYLVFKKDKKLIFYVISAKSNDPNIAYYTAKCVLKQTSDYFISTKTKVAATSVFLLQKEADSLGNVLRNLYTTSASMIDRTYNLNPSITVQRSSSQFNQSKAAAMAGAYSEVLRSLEMAKISLQKETPLYRIIDEPELPLFASPVPGRLSHIIPAVALGLFLMLAALLTQYFYKKPINN